MCVGPLQVGAIQGATDAHLLGADTNHGSSAYALFCQYCNWTSSEIGVELDRPGGIHSQLAKINNGGQPKLTHKDLKDRRKDIPDENSIPDAQLDTDLQFAALKSFYQSELADLNSSFAGLPGQDGLGLASPAALSRIISLYTGRGQGRMQQGSSYAMREARSTEEGLKEAQLDESDAIKKLAKGGWESTTSREQRSLQYESVRFQDQLRPIPYLLRTKRSKRCPFCRHIISKPENKVTSTRFRIRLVAKSYIPNISIRPLQPLADPIPVTSRPGVPEEPPLEPLRPHQYILTFHNPLFERIKVSLATPSTTPGRFASKVTVLCPQFEVDANVDMWDDALKDDGSERRRQVEESSTGQAEAGKIWDKGRNWVSIVLEVVPASLRPEIRDPTTGDDEVAESLLKEDEDILEIPMFVRVEWEVEAQNDIGATSGRDKDAKEKRELAYWCVLGVGRISQE